MEILDVMIDKALYVLDRVKKRLLRNRQTKPSANDVEAQFLKEWTSVLAEYAEVFSGLYTGLAKVAEGGTKKQEKVLREWLMRTHYKFHRKRLEEISRSCLQPVIEGGTNDEYAKWAGLLLNAARKAEIEKDRTGYVVLDESRVNAYVEWNGGELYLGDKVEVMIPAWYQKGNILEQGSCKAAEND